MWVETIKPIATWVLFSVGLPYLLGAVPFGYILVRLKLGKDIRELGSGNIGATNVARVLNSRLWGRVILLLDILKGLIAVVLAGRFIPGNSLAIISAAVFAIIGHILPIYIGFRGGKGVATAIGVLLGVSTFYHNLFFILASGLILWLIFYQLTGFVSIASISMALALFLGSIFFIEDLAIKIMGVIIGILVLYRHRENIRRLLQGEEKKTRL